MTEEPNLQEIGTPGETHTVACHHWEKVSAEAWHRLSAEKAASEVPA